MMVSIGWVIYKEMRNLTHQWLVPAAFDYDAQTQQPVDRWKRAELNYACVEYVAPTEYMASSAVQCHRIVDIKKANEYYLCVW